MGDEEGLPCLVVTTSDLVSIFVQQCLQQVLLHLWWSFSADGSNLKSLAS